MVLSRANCALKENACTAGYFMGPLLQLLVGQNFISIACPPPPSNKNATLGEVHLLIIGCIFLFTGRWVYNWGHCLISSSYSLQFFRVSINFRFLRGPFFFKILLGLGSKGSLFPSYCKWYLQWLEIVETDLELWYCSIWMGAVWSTSKGNIVVLFWYMKKYPAGNILPK